RTLKNSIRFQPNPARSYHCLLRSKTELKVKFIMFFRSTILTHLRRLPPFSGR
ncbi:unnamed protein product, partial [Arabidopsis halleri]